VGYQPARQGHRPHLGRPDLDPSCPSRRRTRST
jgi:hypothetical protein